MDIEYHSAEKLYLEHFAKELLERIMPERYHEIEHSETPDLIMQGGHGIEVTWAHFSDQGQADGILECASGKRYEELERGMQRNIEKAGIKLLFNPESRICGYSFKAIKNRASAEVYFSAYVKKKNKHRDYQTQHTDLFIFPPLTIEKDWFGEEEIKNHLQGIVDTEECPFETIIAYEEPKLYLFGKNNQFQKIEGEASVIKQCKIQADNYSGWSKRRKTNYHRKEEQA